MRAGSVEMASADAQHLAYLPAGHPQGYQDAFNAFTADAYASFQGNIVEGLPTFVDGLRAAVITEAVLASAASQQWVDVPQIRDGASVQLNSLATAPVNR